MERIEPEPEPDVREAVRAALEAEEERPGGAWAQAALREGVGAVSEVEPPSL